MKLKFLALLLAVLMAFSCLTACGETETAEVTEETATEETAEATEEATEEAAETATEETAEAETAPWDGAAAYAKYAPDTVVYTVNGDDVTWEQYYGWLYSVIEQLYSYYGITDWNTELDEGYTTADYIREYAEGMSSEYVLLHQIAASKGVTLTAEEQAEAEAAIQADADEYYDGDLDALYAYLAENFFTPEYYAYMNETAMLYRSIFAATYGEEGANLPDADVLQWLEDNGYMYAKHILIKGIDDAGLALDEETLQEKTDLVIDIYKQLEATPADQLEAKFDELMNEYSEDTGLATNPDGYYFQTGKMVEAFELAAKELEPNTISDVVQSDYGFHILYTSDMDPDDIYSYTTDGEPITVRYQAANDLFSQTTLDWANEMEIVYAPEFENLDLNALFDIPVTETAETETAETETAETAA